MVTAKCKVESVLHYEGQRVVSMYPVWDPDPKSPNHKWSEATPGGKLELTISNPAAFEQFKPGQTVMVDFRFDGE